MARDIVLDAVHAALAPLRPGGVVLAVSGGRDSMTLWTAIRAAGLSDRVAAIAHFNHRSGPASAGAEGLVVATARKHGARLMVGTAASAMLEASEAEWRDARWRFFREALAASDGDRIATGHTQDDQLETVLFRLLRGAGARGLAALDADGGPLRPWLGIARDDIAVWGRRHRVAFRDDPSNSDRRFARNRLRHDLVPALQVASPHAARALMALSATAAAWRRDVEALVRTHAVIERRDGAVRIEAPWLAELDSATASVAWPAVLAAAGITTDRRGTERLARHAATASVSTRIPLAGDIEVVRGANEWIIRRTRGLGTMALDAIPLAAGARFGGWSFARATPNSVESTARGSGEGWHAELPSDQPLFVRAWRPGDRVRLANGGHRRVKRFLAEAQIPAPLREGWPVVAAGGDIVWIPGVFVGTPRQPNAAAVLPGHVMSGTVATPTVCYVCERRSR